MERLPNRKIGGPGLIVEIDETMISKRKNRTRRILPHQRIFGGVCQETKACFAMRVPDRSAATLLEAIKHNIAEGSTIYSDCWKGYKTKDLEAAGFSHLTVNHKLNFVDPKPGTHTQTIERGSAKWRNEKHRGTARSQLKSAQSKRRNSIRLLKNEVRKWAGLAEDIRAPSPGSRMELRRFDCALFYIVLAFPAATCCDTIYRSTPHLSANIMT